MDKTEFKSLINKKQIRENTQKFFEQIREAIEFCIEDGFSCFATEYLNEVIGIGYKEIDNDREIIKSTFGLEVFIEPNEEINLKLVDLNKLNDMLYTFIALNDIKKHKEVLMLDSVFVTDDCGDGERIFHIYFDFNFIPKYIIRNKNDFE